MWERRCAVSADELGVRETGAFKRPSNAIGHFFGGRGYQCAYQAKSVFGRFESSATTKFELSLGKFVNLTGLERTFKSRGQNLTSRGPMT